MEYPELRASPHAAISELQGFIDSRLLIDDPGSDAEADTSEYIENAILGIIDMPGSTLADLAVKARAYLLTGDERLAQSLALGASLLSP